jgi:bacterioferritin
MKGNQEVIDTLNSILTGELSSVDLYFLYSRLMKDKGYTKLFERLDHEMTDEQLHSSMLMERIIFLGGTPSVDHRSGFKLTLDIPKMLNQLLDDELEVRANLVKAISLCEKSHDYVSRDLLITLQKDTEEDHIDWIETQIDLVKNVGLANYLQTTSV